MIRPRQCNAGCFCPSTGLLTSKLELNQNSEMSSIFPAGSGHYVLFFKTIDFSKLVEQSQDTRIAAFFFR